MDGWIFVSSCHYLYFLLFKYFFFIIIIFYCCHYCCCYYSANFCLCRPVFFNQGSTEPKGSAGPPVLSIKLNCVGRFRPPLDVFSRLLVGLQCICGWGSASNPAGGAESTPPLPGWWGGRSMPLPQEPLSRSRLLASNFSPSDLRSPPQKETWVLWAIKISAKGSALLKRLKNTGVDLYCNSLLLYWILYPVELWRRSNCCHKTGWWIYFLNIFLSVLLSTVMHFLFSPLW